MHVPGIALKVDAKGLHGHKAQVFLEGVDISHGLRRLVLFISNDDIVTAEISIDVREIDVSAQAIAMLQAHVRHDDSETVIQDSI